MGCRSSKPIATPTRPSTPPACLPQTLPFQALHPEPLYSMVRASRHPSSLSPANTFHTPCLPSFLFLLTTRCFPLSLSLDAIHFSLTNKPVLLVKGVSTGRDVKTSYTHSTRNFTSYRHCAMKKKMLSIEMKQAASIKQTSKQAEKLHTGTKSPH